MAMLRFDMKNLSDNDRAELISYFQDIINQLIYNEELSKINCPIIFCDDQLLNKINKLEEYINNLCEKVDKLSILCENNTDEISTLSTKYESVNDNINKYIINILDNKYREYNKEIVTIFKKNITSLDNKIDLLSKEILKISSLNLEENINKLSNLDDKYKSMFDDMKKFILNFLDDKYRDYNREVVTILKKNLISLDDKIDLLSREIFKISSVNLKKEYINTIYEDIRTSLNKIEFINNRIFQEIKSKTR